MGMAAEQQQINDLATALNSVSDHVTTASTTLAQWIADHQGEIDMTPALNALSGLQAADQTLQATVPQAPAAPLPDPVPDPGPVETDPTTPPAVDPSLPPPSDGGPDTGTGDQPQVNPLG